MYIVILLAVLEALRCYVWPSFIPLRRNVIWHSRIEMQHSSVFESCINQMYYYYYYTRWISYRLLLRRCILAVCSLISPLRFTVGECYSVFIIFFSDCTVCRRPCGRSVDTHRRITHRFDFPLNFRLYKLKCRAAWGLIYLKDEIPVAHFPLKPRLSPDPQRAGQMEKREYTPSTLQQAPRGRWWTGSCTKPALRFNWTEGGCTLIP